MEYWKGQGHNSFSLSLDNLSSSYLQELFHTTLDAPDTGKVTAINFGRLALRVANEATNVVVLPVAQSNGASFAFAGIIVGGHDRLVAWMFEVFVMVLHDGVLD